MAAAVQGLLANRWVGARRKAQADRCPQGLQIIPLILFLTHAPTSWTAAQAVQFLPCNVFQTLLPLNEFLMLSHTSNFCHIYFGSLRMLIIPFMWYGFLIN